MKSTPKGASQYDELNDAEWLREKYVEENLSTSEIADIVECGTMTVNNHLARHGIERDRSIKNVKNERVTDEEWLREQYVEEQRSAADIADELGYGSSKHVVKWLKRHGIEVRSGGETVWYPELNDEEYLREKYTEERMTLSELAEEIGCSPKAVHDALQKHEVIETSGSRDLSRVAPLRTNTRGYVVWQLSHDATQEPVHRLLAIAEGEDPHKMYSDGYHCHHENGVPWDNRPSNIRVVSHSEHTRIHNQERWSN